MTGQESVRATATIVNKKGLHARASAKFVETAAKFRSEITVTKGDASVSGRSIMGLMMLAARKRLQGCLIRAAPLMSTRPAAGGAVRVSLRNSATNHAQPLARTHIGRGSDVVKICAGLGACGFRA